MCIMALVAFAVHSLAMDCARLPREAASPCRVPRAGREQTDASMSALVIRAATLTQAQAERVREWHTLLRGSEFGLYAMVDKSEGSPARRAIDALSSILTPKHVYTYTVADLAARFAATVPELEATLTGTQARYNWAFHIESICSFAREKLAMRFRHLWVVEADVGFSGSVLAFLRFYQRHSGDDLIMASEAVEAWRQPPLKRKRKRGVTRAFERAFPDQFVALEYAARFSARLIAKLERLSRDAAVSGWSEIAIPTIAKGSGLNVSAIGRGHLDPAQTPPTRVQRAKSLTAAEWHATRVRDLAAELPRSCDPAVVLSRGAIMPTPAGPHADDADASSCVHLAVHSVIGRIYHPCKT